MTAPKGAQKISRRRFAGSATATLLISEDDDDDFGFGDDDDDDRTSQIPPVSYPGVQSAAPGAIYPGVLSAAPRPAPGVAAAQPVPPVAANVPRPVQTPSVLPVAGQIGADLPRLAALAGLGLVASGLGLRLRERLLGRRPAATPPTEPQYEGEVSDTYLDDRM